MKNNASKNNMRELNLQVCSGTYQLNREFDFFFFNLKHGRGKYEEETASSITKIVQDNPCLKKSANALPCKPLFC